MLAHTHSGACNNRCHTHRNGITVEEVLSYVNNDAGQLLNNDPLLQRFTGMMDYMENKGLAAEEVFSCLEVFVDSGGQTIYNAFGNLTEVLPREGLWLITQEKHAQNNHTTSTVLTD